MRQFHLYTLTWTKFLSLYTLFVLATWSVISEDHYKWVGIIVVIRQACLPLVITMAEKRPKLLSWGRGVNGCKKAKIGIPKFHVERWWVSTTLLPPQSQDRSFQTKVTLCPSRSWRWWVELRQNVAKASRMVVTPRLASTHELFTVLTFLGDICKCTRVFLSLQTQAPEIKSNLKPWSLQ